MTKKIFMECQRPAGLCRERGFTTLSGPLMQMIFCLQETKLQEGQIDLDLPGYHQYWNYAEKKGYSGTAVFTQRRSPESSTGSVSEEHDHEGRVITLEFEDFYLTWYTPNSQKELTRLAYRMEWEAAFLAYLKKLEKKATGYFLRRSECCA